MFFISILFVLISFYLFFNKNTREKEGIFAFCFLIGFTTGLAKKELQIYWVLMTMTPLIIFILVRTHDYLKNRQI
jgi:hypothetical protein